MKKLLAIFICGLLVQPSVSAQSKIGLENYNYLQSSGEGLLIVPVIHIEGRNNWHTEFRYNYEDVQTASLFFGRTLSGGNKLHFAITPMGGYSVGKFSGYSCAINLESQWNSFYISSQTQYSVATKNNVNDFFFSWSELGYEVTKTFFSGIAFQYTREAGNQRFEPGFTAGLSFGNLSFPCYVLSPFLKERYFILGITYEYSTKENKLKRR
jgi:hypothetical protein